MTTLTLNDQILCHCLNIRMSQVEDAVKFGGCETIKDVMNQTEAGKGCTACHARIRRAIKSSQTVSQSCVGSL